MTDYFESNWMQIQIVSLFLLSKSKDFYPLNCMFHSFTNTTKCCIEFFSSIVVAGLIECKKHDSPIYTLFAKISSPENSFESKLQFLNKVKSWTLSETPSNSQTILPVCNWTPISYLMVFSWFSTIVLMLNKIVQWFLNRTFCCIQCYIDSMSLIINNSVLYMNLSMLLQ